MDSTSRCLAVIGALALLWTLVAACGDDVMEEPSATTSEHRLQTGLAASLSTEIAERNKGFIKDLEALAESKPSFAAALETMTNVAPSGPRSVIQAEVPEDANVCSQDAPELPTAPVLSKKDYRPVGSESTAPKPYQPASHKSSVSMRDRVKAGYFSGSGSKTTTVEVP